MNTPKMTSLQRVLTTLGQQEPDRVPFFLLLTMTGAKELGLSLQDYFSKAEYVVEAQLRMRKKFQHDCLYSFLYASLEVEAFGGDTIYIDDGPPNAGAPIISKPQDILSLTPPRIEDHPCLQKVLEIERQLKAKVQDDAPIIGVVISPFSLPVMQMGFEGYLNLMLNQPDLFARLMQVNEAFCVNWANAQLAAGATAICYFDPVSSTTIITREQYLESGYQVARRVLPQIKGPTATHFASGRCLPIVEEVAQTGTMIFGISTSESLGELKKAVHGRATLIGNLNGVEMRRWSAEKAEAEVKKAIAEAGPGGGFILSDSHGEIPYQVSEETLLAISEAVHTWGRYPLDWAAA
ncbi:MAG TPA: uroporphyrinogen decarboxylase family protein [Anaerolineaceae bacterium]|nr:uroporphyrinogen decarboxylase family protein [Anaerolineaceae bacterium]HPN50448.1 uroporphyrinogen decarboxylase family protein [Anaerolineaceae bacterium]